jgi:hypothetical protein
MRRLRLNTVGSWWCRCLLLLALSLCFAGCRALIGPEGEQAAEDAKPWNQPAAWEGQVLGVPY